MKANINLEISKDDLNYELENLVSEIASEQIRKLVKEKAESLVEMEIKRIISPIVDTYLEDAQVGREHISYHDKTPSRRNVDQYISRILKDYLDEPTFLYSKSSSKMSERYSRSSGEKTTRAEHWIKDKVREYVDKELFVVIENKINETVKALTPSEEQIQEIIKKEVMEKFK